MEEKILYFWATTVQAELRSTIGVTQVGCWDGCKTEWMNQGVAGGGGGGGRGVGLQFVR